MIVISIRNIISITIIVIIITIIIIIIIIMILIIIIIIMILFIMISSSSSSSTCCYPNDKARDSAPRIPARPDLKTPCKSSKLPGAWPSSPD